MSATSSASDRTFDLRLDLLIGPTGQFTDAELERGWKIYGPELTDHVRAGSQPGWRPWSWWRFEADREEPSDPEGVAYLAARGELTDREIAAVAERANEARMRVGTPREHHGPDCHPDRDAVDLDEAVKRALG